MKKFLLVTLVALSVCDMAMGMSGSSQTDFTSANTELSRSDKDVIIVQALDLKLPSTDKIILQEVDETQKRIEEKVSESNYEEAIEITFSALTRYPKNFALQSELAALLGDCSEVTPQPLKDRMVQKSKALFDRLINEVDGQPKSVFYPFKNEYFYRFAKYRDQYELGQIMVEDYWETDEFNSVGRKGYYSQGVGATNYARVLLEKDNKPLALHYAQKAVVAWAQYFSYTNDYYNAYVHYALALGILGYKQEMMRALAKSASLIKRDMDYFEFKEVIDFIEKVNVQYS